MVDLNFVLSNREPNIKHTMEDHVVTYIHGLHNDLVVSRVYPPLIFSSYDSMTGASLIMYPPCAIYVV